jgi:predicted Zn finger-like uncharacterized protein
MLIRCECCQAEYELDEAQVRSGRSEVRCRVCGHIFSVAEPGSDLTADGASAGSEEPVGVDWLLRTADGKVHQFSGLRSLQGAIVERKVTRTDRVSSDGQTWRYAGQIVELTPFFEVVEETDHVRAEAVSEHDQTMHVEPARHAPVPLTQTRLSPQAMAVSGQDDDIRDSRLTFPTVGTDAEEDYPPEHTHGALKIFVGLTVAAGVAFAGIQWQRGRIHSTTIAARASASVSASAEGRRPMVSPPDARPTPETAPAAAQVPAATETPSPPTHGPAVEAPPSPPPAEANSASDKTDSTGSAVAPSESYEKLVASGDRALENGSNSKAKDFYQRALRLRPAGTQAISGLGFVALDLGQIPAAYEQFKRALALNPSLGSAVFGMAEIHRARGEKALALQSYKRYLQVSPKGSEAAAARRQVSALQPAPQAEPQPAPQPEGE